MAGDARIRLFCALELPPATVDEVVAWQAAHLSAAQQRGARIVPSGNLHITLAFLGSRDAGELPAIAGALAEAAGAASPAELRPTRYRETRSVGMILYDDPSGAATALAAAVGERLEQLGVYQRERRPWLPHVTVLRFKERAGLVPELANIRSFRAVRTALYSSTLRPGGAQYEALETAALGGR
ncbi:MAG TPA: RNA 2',3'-cyclic phosphodiesterase [Gaiellaceae bacterium]